MDQPREHALIRSPALRPGDAALALRFASDPRRQNHFFLAQRLRGNVDAATRCSSMGDPEYAEDSRSERGGLGVCGPSGGRGRGDPRGVYVPATASNVRMARSVRFGALAFPEVDVPHAAWRLRPGSAGRVLVRVRVPGPRSRCRAAPGARCRRCPQTAGRTLPGSCLKANSGAWTPTTTRPSRRYASYHAFTCGSSRNQIPYVQAQKFTSTTFPRRPARVSGRPPGVLSHRDTLWKSGAGP